MYLDAIRTRPAAAPRVAIFPLSEISYRACVILHKLVFAERAPDEL